MTDTPIAATEGGLVACPFCGSTEDVSFGGRGDYRFAICPTCGAQGPRVRFGSSRDKWNTRTPSSLGEDVVERVVEPDINGALIDMLQRDHVRMRRAGGVLAEAALRVIRECDGLHRLSLAVAEWANAIAAEGDRPHGEARAALSALRPVEEEGK